MKSLFNHKYFSHYNNTEWNFIKVSLVWFWLRIVWDVSISREALPFPQGLCSLINCSMLVSVHTVQVCLAFALILSLLYLLERWMTFTTGAMFFLSFVLFTLQDSNGIFPRNGLYTVIFLVQCVAYLRNHAELNKERIQFPIQIIAAGYFLAAISKLSQSGWQWIWDAPLASLQIVKSFAYQYFDTGDVSVLNTGLEYADFGLTHPGLVQLLFALSLLLELFAWLAVRNKIWAFSMGLSLLAMHMGIDFFMHILIKSIYYPMVIFMLNPVYLIYAAIKYLLRKSSLPPSARHVAN